MNTTVLISHHRKTNPTFSRFRVFALAAAVLFYGALAANAGPAATATPGPWVPDQGDGTYRNPVIYADYSDPDAIRVGDDYWLTASSFNHVPGLPILHSKDLVNWTIVNHALQVNPPGEYYSTTRHGLGVYAPSIRYHAGKFWIYYGDPDFGIYLVTATDPRGKWSEPVLVQKGKGYIDTCPIWDDDGKAYLVCGWAASRGRRANLLTLHEMSPDGTKLIGEGKTIIDGRTLGWKILEGPKFYKRDGYYWVFAPAGGVATGFQGVFRSRNIWGPYESRIVLEQGTTPTNGPHQGAWVNTPKGEDWFLHFQKAGPYGRITHLQPMRWREDGWPVMGNDPDNDGKGEPVLAYEKPDLPVQPVATPATSDEFDSPALGLQWQWEANPRPDWWSLSATRGSMRLSCVPRTKTDTLQDAPNLLMQKFPAPSFAATTLLRFSPKADGDTAGLIVFGRNYTWLGLRQNAGKTQLQLVNYRDKGDGKEDVAGTVELKGNVVYLRVSVSEKQRSSFEWSEDGERFTRIGGEFPAAHLGWVGAKFGIFASAASGATASGHADFDWFRVGNVSKRTSAEIVQIMEKAADWQLANKNRFRPDDWVNGAFYTGLLALADVSKSPRFHDAMLAIAEENQWRIGPRIYYADDHCVGQAYAELYLKHKDPRMIAPMRDLFDYVLKYQKNDDLTYASGNPNQPTLPPNFDALDKWCWCDALFMAPPAWIRLWAATGNQAYLDFAVSKWWVTSDVLYDKQEHLYYRDTRFFERREENGQKVFWARGNGWVLAALARVMQYLPKDHPERPRFEKQFVEIAERVRELQQDDGFWRAGLLDAESYSAKESSGTGFFCYAFTWGVNNGLLDPEKFTTVIWRAWDAIAQCVQADGKLIHVQPIGSSPGKFPEDSTEAYGVGAFLLAGSELLRMTGDVTGPAQTKISATR